MQALPTLVPELKGVDIQVSGIRDDARQVKAGDLFLAVSGERYSAQQMLEDIQQSGAAAALYDASERLDEGRLKQIPLFAIENLNTKRGHIASRFYADPTSDMYVVGVTGTNGKTSCTQYIASALSSPNANCGVIGTMGWGFPPNLSEPGLTTPGALRLQELFYNLLQQDANAVCVEVSSHGLVQERLAGVSFDTAVFTNLTRDHLDYHGSLEAYQAAKKRLFSDFAIQLAVLNKDDVFSQDIERSLANDVELLTYSLHDVEASVYCSRLEFSAAGIDGVVESPWGQFPMKSSLIGDFNASNLLAVICVLGSKGFSADQISSRISELVNVKGRMDRIDLGNGAVAVIDYAHTPDALKNALKALRHHVDGQLICVMGCGGDRDVGKRPLMGDIASRLADVAVVTDDNPRSEPPEEIIDHILAGVHGNNATAISDRSRAIQHALSMASAGDIVLIAGKGHEPYQEIAGKRIPFSDHEEVEKFVRASQNVQTTRDIVVGFGVTGQSVARYLRANNKPFVVVEERNTAAVEQFAREVGQVERLDFSDLAYSSQDRLLLSPGVPVRHPEVQRAIKAGVKLWNDIALFAETDRRPLCLITGSNGKSTVTHYVDQLFDFAGTSCEPGGNFGIPALDLLERQAAAVVLEVSSYQLEVATDCHPRVAVLLNLSPDHLDRYDTVEDYYLAKTHVFNHAEIAIYCRDIDFDLGIAEATQVITFGLDAPEDGHFGVVEVDGTQTLMFGSQVLLPVSSLPYSGSQDVLNVLAALAVCHGMGLELSSVVAGVKKLEGLAHRFEILDQTNGHLVINDSKSTNPASTIAALNNLAGETRPIDLILGGLSKGADFLALKSIVQNRVQRCFVYGADREVINQQLGGAALVNTTLKDCLDQLALSSDEPRVVLFSPGCASLDQFANFAARGEFFKQQVRELHI